METQAKVQVVKGRYVIDYNNRTQTIAQWSKETGIPIDTLRYRIRSGWEVDKALTEPVHSEKYSPPVKPRNKLKNPVKILLRIEDADLQLVDNYAKQHKLANRTEAIRLMIKESA